MPPPLTAAASSITPAPSLSPSPPSPKTRPATAAASSSRQAPRPSPAPPSPAMPPVESREAGSTSTVEARSISATPSSPPTPHRMQPTYSKTARSSHQASTSLATIQTPALLKFPVSSAPLPTRSTPSSPPSAGMAAPPRPCIRWPVPPPLIPPEAGTPISAVSLVSPMETRTPPPPSTSVPSRSGR